MSSLQDAQKFIVRADAVRVGDIAVIWDEDFLDQVIVEVTNVWQPNTEGVVQFTMHALNGTFTRTESWSTNMIVVHREPPPPHWDEHNQCLCDCAMGGPPPPVPTCSWLDDENGDG